MKKTGAAAVLVEWGSEQTLFCPPFEPGTLTSASATALREPADRTDWPMGTEIMTISLTDPNQAGPVSAWKGKTTPFAVQCLSQPAGMAGFRCEQDNGIGREEKEIRLPWRQPSAASGPAFRWL